MHLTLNERQVALLANAATMYSDQLAEMSDDEHLRKEEPELAEWAERAAHDTERLAQLLTWEAHCNSLTAAIMNDLGPGRIAVHTKQIISAALEYDNLTLMT